MILYVKFMSIIKISKDLFDELNKLRKDNDTFEDVLWDLLEVDMELSEETKKNIKLAEKNIKEGKVYSLDEVKEKILK